MIESSTVATYKVWQGTFPWAAREGIKALICLMREDDARVMELVGVYCEMGDNIEGLESVLRSVV